MPSIKIKNPLKAGESIVGEVEKIYDKSVVFKLKDDTFAKMSLPEEVIETISDDYDGDIIRLSRDADGEYEIEELDEFPEEKK